jgi:hypothetical protein
MMFTHLPLDDALNQLFYFDGGTSRLVWDNALGRCVLRRAMPRIALADAVLMIARGELLWAVPDTLPSLVAGTPSGVVHRERTLLMAFLRSPAARRITRWSARRRLELWTREAAEWLAHRELVRGDADTAEEE